MGLSTRDEVQILEILKCLRIANKCLMGKGKDL